MKILHNRNLDELNEDTDLLGLGNKSKAIQFFIENLIEDNNVQMIALYGEWGSGKTSIMRDIKLNLAKDKKNNFCSIFFEAWKHEKDDNIALSLLSVLTDDSIDNKVADDAFKSAVDLFKSFGSGLSFNLSILGTDVKFDAGKMMKNYNDFQNARHNISFHKIQERFKTQIGLIENEILEKNKLNVKEGKIVVFLDDLDRCEPNVVLDLLASIKLFYTYGTRLIFVCGIDKLAIQNAVRTKYDEIIKSEEYLEKIFDASFQVPSIQTYDKLLKFYFKDVVKQHRLVIDVLSEFFNSINFNSPRHLKKLLNKYAILVEYKNSENFPIELKELIPNIIDDTGRGNYIETLITLYLIILKESHPISYDYLENHEKKISLITNAYHNSRPANSNGVKPFSESLKHIVSNVFDRKFHNTNLSSIKTVLIQASLNPNRNEYQMNRTFNEFYTLFLPGTGLESFDIQNPPSPNLYIKQFENNDNQTSTNFCQYLSNNLEKFLLENWSDYHFQNYFRMIKDLL